MNQVSNLQTSKQVLFVAWQDQKTKQYYPIGRLLRSANGDSPRYEFCYLRGAEEACRSGFIPFPALPEFKQIYFSNELFPLFENRLMPRSRPDFNEFVRRLDLDPKTADEFEILARSGGRRSTDSIELYPLPDLDRAGCYDTFFLAHGIRYLTAISFDRILKLKKDEALFLQWDLANEADPRALSLRTEDRIIVGYLPRYLLDDVWSLLIDCDFRPTIKVIQVNPPTAPIQQRLLCRMEACWPQDFKPYCGPEYKPLAPSATRLDCA